MFLFGVFNLVSLSWKIQNILCHLFFPFKVFNKCHKISRNILKLQNQLPVQICYLVSQFKWMLFLFFLFLIASHSFWLLHSLHLPSIHSLSITLCFCSISIFSNPLSVPHLSLCIFFPHTPYCLFIPPSSVLLRIKIHFAAGEPVGCLRLAEPGPDLVVLPAECQRSLGQWAVWTTSLGPLWAPVWPRDR